MPPTDIEQFEKLRPLGLLEQWSTARHHLGFYNNVGVSISYAGPCQVPLRSLVFSAFSVVISQQPILSALPVGEDTKSPYFARLAKIDLDQAVTFISRQKPYNGLDHDEELDELLEIQHNMNFKNNYGVLPFWRLIVITIPEAGPELNFVASFIFHHALGDGLSGVAFHDSFFSALKTIPDLRPKEIISTPNTQLLSELDRLHSLSLPLESSSRDRSGLWTGERVQTPLVSRLRSLAVSKETTGALTKACRDHGTTLTATVQVIVAVALFQVIPEESIELDCSVPVSIRHWLPGIDNTSMGNYIDGLMETYRRHELTNFSWAEVQRSRETVQKYMAGGGEFLNAARIKLISNIVDSFSTQIGKQRNSSFDVSNLGLIDDALKRNGHIWQRERALFSRSASVTQGALSVGMVTGGDGCLVLGLVWQEGIVGEALIDSLVRKIKTEIEALTGS